MTQPTSSLPSLENVSPLLAFICRTNGWIALLLAALPLGYCFGKAEPGSTQYWLCFTGYALCSGPGLTWGFLWLMGQVVRYPSQEKRQIEAYTLPRWMNFPLIELILTGVFCHFCYGWLTDPPEDLRREVMGLISFTLFWAMICVAWLTEVLKWQRAASEDA